MNYKKIILTFIWVIMAFAVIDVGFELISMPNTFLNIVGLCSIFIYTLISIKTKCFTKFKNKKDENEKF